MKTRLLLKLAASSLVLGATLVGCQTTGHHTLASASKADPAKAAAAAQQALSAKQPARAVTLAEAAVAASPQDAANRALLGQAYLAAGRFASAETAYTDALTLDPDNGRARLSLALVQVALGRHEAARETLAQLPPEAAVADVGLAYALAGDRQRAIEMLGDAARIEGASPKTRQNLALAYALSGRWVEARSTAAIDVPADQLGDRMASWAQFTQPQSNYDQVATLLGVQPVVDEGQPARLALAAPVAEEAPVALAAAEPASPALPTEPVSLAEPAPAPAPIDPAPQTGFAAAEPAAPATTPMMMAAAADPSPFVTAPEKPAPLIMAAATPIKEAVARPRALPRPASGNWVVQLGAFRSADRVEIAWERALGRMQALGGFSPSSTTYVSTRRSATFYRLSVAGFGSHAEASEVCRQVKSVGGACFVRGVAGDAPIQWVSRKTGGEA